MISLNELNTLPDDAFVAQLAGIYEHSEWVARQVIAQKPFRKLSCLRDAMRDAVNHASDDAKLTLIRAHPDLAGKLARAGALTASSTQEQAGLGLDRLSAAEFEQFTTYNTRYHDRFGFPFIICARKTTKLAVLAAFETRLTHSRPTEIAEALTQIHQIADLRLQDSIAKA
jgi:2-oxo-4-hydroxy-4-carboxy-5-ureidoimidazoline decarboxylase